MLADEVCVAWNVKACPGVLWYSLGTSPRAKVHEERGPYLCETIQSGGTIQKRWTGWTTQQGDDHRAVGGKSKMPHEMLLRDSESRSTGSRFWWNPENTYLQISDFANRTRAAKLVVKKLPTRRTRYQTFWYKPSRHSRNSTDRRHWNPGFDLQEK